MTSFMSESHSVSHVSHLQGSRESFWEEVVSLDSGEDGNASFRETLWASWSASLDVPVPSGLASTISSMIMYEVTLQK